MPSLYPVILSGGSGTRLWPLSRKSYPKQLLPLIGDESLLQATVRRLRDVGCTGSLRVIANDDHRFMVRRQLADIAERDSAIILEPVGRNTAPAVAVAALSVARAEGPDAIVGIFPSDHFIRDTTAFGAVLDQASAAAGAGHIATLSIAPTRPETGYGYIRRGDPLSGIAGVHTVSSFVEKPDEPTAQTYVDSGEYGWNSGMFVFRADVMIDALETHAPDCLVAARRALDNAHTDLDFLRLDRDGLDAAPAISIDYAVMEKTDRAAAVAADIGWSDLGAWNALHEIAEKDERGNATTGPAFLRDATGTLVRAEDGRLVAALGLEDAVIVSTADAVMVAPMARAAEVKDLLADLSAADRAEATENRRVTRPWGTYEDIDREDNFRVKRIVVDPGARLSLQRHAQRSEHWVVVRGTAHVTINGEETVLSRNQSTYVPIGATHRLENRGTEPLHLIEVQVGDYVEEDDIERLDDVYGRS